MVPRALMVGSCLTAAALAADLPRADDPCHFTPADKLAMVRLVRRVAEAGRAVDFDAATMPAKLLRTTGRPAFVSAHRPGRDPLVALAEEGALLEQLTEATLDLVRRGRLGLLRHVRFKIDLVDRATPMGQALPLGFTDLPVLGIHGLHVRGPDKDLYLLPTEALRRDLDHGEAFLRHAIQQAGPPPGRLEALRLERFTTVSVIERPGGEGPPLDLTRGMPLSEHVSRDRVLAAARAATEYLLRAQEPDGRFPALYHAARDEMGKATDLVRHAGTAWSLAQAGRALREDRLLDRARRAVAWLLRHVRIREPMAWVEYEGRCPLGGAALAVLAVLELRAATGETRHDETLRRLGHFLVFMQRPDGGFWSDYQPEAHRGVVPKGRLPLYAPGQATLALAHLHQALPDDAWAGAAVAAADWLATARDEWNARAGLEYVHPDSWTVLAVDQLHALGLARRAHVDYALFLAHRIIEEQDTPRTARWRDHVGAPRETPPRVGPAASRCEGLLAAWRLAQRLGADPAPYRRAALLSARFQLAHQYDAANAYLLPNPLRARGGFYTSYADHSIRTDSVQHNLSALLALAELLAE